MQKEVTDTQWYYKVDQTQPKTRMIRTTDPMTRSEIGEYLKERYGHTMMALWPCHE